MTSLNLNSNDYHCISVALMHEIDLWKKFPSSIGETEISRLEKLNKKIQLLFDDSLLKESDDYE